jgi:MSHA pilin protein MshD
MSKPAMRIFSNKQAGLTLIEAIIFILIIGIALSAIISVYIFTTRHSANTMLSLKTIELSQALMDEILAKGFDDKTPLGGGCVQMSNAGKTNCSSGVTPASDPDAAGKPLGAEEPNRTLFDDVDDFHNISYCGDNVSTPDASCTAGCTDLEDETGTDISAEYAGYSVCIRVSYAGGEMNNITAGGGGTTAIASNDAKRIDLIVRDPLDARMVFTAYKANF